MRYLIISLFCAGLVAVSLVVWPSQATANGIIVSTDGRTAARGARSPVRMTRHDVKARLSDQIAHVTVEHTFHSEATVQLEGTYLFPLPDGAIVSDFAMTMNGKMVQGEVIEANRARAIYNSIVRRRQDPGLLEYVGRGLFRARVFPIEPGGDIRVRLRFQQVLPQDAGVLEFRYPLATDRFHHAPVDSTVVDIEIDSSVDLKGIYSPSHDFTLTRRGERSAHTRIEQSRRRQTKDLLLYVGRSPDAVGFSLLSNKAPGEDGTFMAVLAPQNEPQDTARVPKDVVFVLDTSGSMKGPKIAQAKAALQYGVRTLQSGDRFNIIAFASGIVPFRDGLIDATNETKEAAVRWIEGRNATGSTFISKALADALAMHADKRLSIVVFLTDGKPTIGVKDTRELVRHVVRSNRSSARVFTFGVGHDLDVVLMDRIAEETGGTRDYVAPGEDIEIVTGRFFRKISQPVMTNVAVDLGPGVYDVYPGKIPDLFAGNQIVLYGRYKSAGPRKISLAGTVAGQRLVHEHDTTLAPSEDNDFLPRLWANRKVMFLLDQIRLHGSAKEIVDEIVKLATRHAIVTPYTAGLVTDLDPGLREPSVQSASPLAQMGGGVGLRDFGRRRRLPGGGVAPGLREPTDPTPVPPPPPSMPPMTPPPSPTPAAGPPTSRPTQTSQDLKRRKAASRADDRYLRGAIKTTAGKTFTFRNSGRWVDTTWDGKGKTVKVTAFTDAYFKLLSKDKRVAKYLAVGKRVVFVLGETAYEIVPPKKK